MFNDRNKASRLNAQDSWKEPLNLRCLEVLEAANLQISKTSGNEYYFVCPQHDDHDPSLKINGSKNVWMCGPCGKKGNAWALVAFLAGCDPNNKTCVMTWLREHGLVRDNKNGERVLTAEYIYTDENQTPLLKVQRYTLSDPPVKTFLQSRPDGNGGWIPGTKGVRRVPYRLPDFLDKDTVFIVEGEGVADDLSEWNLPTTTSPMGAGKWRSEYNQHFDGKNVVILPDNDDPGEAHAEQVAKNLFPIAKAVKIVTLPDLSAKGDFSDWKAAGGTLDELKQIIELTSALSEDDLTQFSGTHKQSETSPTIAEILSAAGFDQLTEDSTGDDIETVVRSLSSHLQGADQVRHMVVRQEASKRLSKIGVKAPTALLDAALGTQQDQSEKVAEEQQVEPWPEPVDGAELLDEIKNWVGGYVVVSDESLDAITLWTVATWFVEDIYFAPILALLSPTKRSGKTLVLDLLNWICRRPTLTSGVGVTSAVIFRMNEQYQPTFLIDEAEKLGGRNADKEIIGFLNQGYRRGGKVLRLREKKGGYAPEEFNAFGFRAVAAIGNLWDTIIDRSVVISMKRKPQRTECRRYNGRVVKREGKELARRICRFAQDNTEALAKLEVSAPRPDWLNDRACDNWSALFTVAALAEGDWPKSALDAAKVLSNVVEVADQAERLIHDTRQVFQSEGWPEVIKSGDLVENLNKIESSSWGDFRKGQGISTHKLADMFKPFGIEPQQYRDSHSEKIRGYWLKDLQGVFERYPPPSEVGQLGQPNNDRGSSDFQSGTENESCPTSESSETPTNTGLSQLSQSERGDNQIKEATGGYNDAAGSEEVFEF